MISLPNTTGTGIVMGSGSNYLATSFTLAAWVHRVGAGTTINTGSWTSYVNGVQDGISFVTTNSLQVRTPDTTSLQGVGIGIGVTSAAAKSGAWNGFVSEVCIWNTVLDATEVAALAKSKIIGTPLQIRPAALQGYWQLNEAGHNVGLPLTAKFIQDRSGKNNHGTAFGKVSGSAEYILSYQ